jgi:hydrogenase maturation protease
MRILVACIGNIFLGDDGFGVAVAHCLSQRTLPEGVVLRDFGIRGLDLTYALLESWDLTILVDACPRDGTPGEIYVIEPELNDASPARLDPHGMDPVQVLEAARSMGGATGPILLVGCEPADFGPDEGRLGLSAPVEAAVDRAAAIVESLIAERRATVT